MRSKSWLTFDCYDTLVDYSNSKVSCISHILNKKPYGVGSLDKVIKTFDHKEKELQMGPFIPLDRVLRLSLRDAMQSIGEKTTLYDEISLINSVKNASPFLDVLPALRSLKSQYKIALLSNSQPDIISNNVNEIGLKFDTIVLATDAKCYKPEKAIFQVLLDRIDQRAENVTHIAQSFYHDLRTSQSLGFGRSIWINRFDKMMPIDCKPDVQLRDLNELVEFL